MFTTNSPNSENDHLIAEDSPKAPCSGWLTTQARHTSSKECVSTGIGVWSVPLQGILLTLVYCTITLIVCDGPIIHRSYVYATKSSQDGLERP